MGQSLAQPRFASTRLRNLEQPADLTQVGQRDGIDAPLRHLLDRGDDIGVGSLCVIGLGQHGIDLGALRRNGADQCAVVLLGIKLQAQAMSGKIDAG